MLGPRTPVLRDHIRGTYLSLRWGVGTIGIVLPFLLWGGGALLDREPLRGSMSAYYYSPHLRDVFVGGLIAIGLALVLYRGFSRAEDWALNVAGALAAGVALVPTTPPDSTGEPGISLHGTLAVAFFACIAYVCVFRASDTLSLIRDVREARRLRRIYGALGFGMVISPALAAVLTLLFQVPEEESTLTFFLEAVAVWIFAAYWVLKSRELRRTEAERLALEGKLKSVSTVTRTPGRLVQVEPDEIRVGDWRSVEVQ